MTSKEVKAIVSALVENRAVIEAGILMGVPCCSSVHNYPGSATKSGDELSVENWGNFAVDEDGSAVISNEHDEAVIDTETATWKYYHYTKDVFEILGKQAKEALNICISNSGIIDYNSNIVSAVIVAYVLFKAMKSYNRKLTSDFIKYEAIRTFIDSGNYDSFEKLRESEDVMSVFKSEGELKEYYEKYNSNVVFSIINSDLLFNSYQHGGSGPVEFATNIAAEIIAKWNSKISNGEGPITYINLVVDSRVVDEWRRVSAFPAEPLEIEGADGEDPITPDIPSQELDVPDYYELKEIVRDCYKELMNRNDGIGIICLSMLYRKMLTGERGYSCNMCNFVLEVASLNTKEEKTEKCLYLVIHCLKHLYNSKELAKVTEAISLIIYNEESKGSTYKKLLATATSKSKENDDKKQMGNPIDKISNEMSDVLNKVKKHLRKTTGVRYEVSKRK